MNTWPFALLFALPFALMAMLMAVDEGHFHRKRGLGRFEALGHPADALSVALPLALAAFAPRETPWLVAFVVLALFSCVFVTKDEGVHLKECPPAEQRLHALLFMLHPLVFFAAHRLWAARAAGSNASTWILRVEVLAVTLVGIYQLLAWRKAWLPTRET